ncbi:unnamed protein product [Citrullus colocynthis]|uniref:Uncharacterized protein n=1 Tax=Citrullus colocynthis TaxID=252529 RepID=A0ABP0Y6F5_9ROSI
MPVLEISRGLGTLQKSRVQEILHHTFSCNFSNHRKKKQSGFRTPSSLLSKIRATTIRFEKLNMEKWKRKDSPETGAVFKAMAMLQALASVLQR